MTGVARESSVPLFLQIEEELKGEIADGKIGRLSRLPSEHELTARFDVSRMTVRKALDRMVADGLLFRQPGKGTYVAPAKIEHIASQALSFSDAMSQHGLASTTVVLSSGITKAPSSINAKLGVGLDEAVVFLRRLRYVEGETMAIHQSYLPIRWAPILDRDLTGSLTHVLDDMGARVTDVEDSVEAILAAEDDAHLLQIPVGSPLLHIGGVARSANGAIVRYSEALYRGDRFNLRVSSAQVAPHPSALWT